MRSGHGSVRQRKKEKKKINFARVTSKKKLLVGLGVQCLDVQLVQPGFLPRPHCVDGLDARQLGHVGSHLGLLYGSVLTLCGHVCSDQPRSIPLGGPGLAWTQTPNELHPDIGLVLCHRSSLDGWRRNWRDDTECALDSGYCDRVCVTSSWILYPGTWEITHGRLGHSWRASCR